MPTFLGAKVPSGARSKLNHVHVCTGGGLWHLRGQQLCAVCSLSLSPLPPLSSLDKKLGISNVEIFVKKRF